MIARFSGASRNADTCQLTDGDACRVNVNRPAGARPSVLAFFVGKRTLTPIDDRYPPRGYSGCLSPSGSLRESTGAITLPIGIAPPRGGSSVVTSPTTSHQRLNSAPPELPSSTNTV